MEMNDRKRFVRHNIYSTFNITISLTENESIMQVIDTIESHSRTTYWLFIEKTNFVTLSLEFYIS